MCTQVAEDGVCWEPTEELHDMLLDCGAQQRVSEKNFPLLAGPFCMLKKEYMQSFESLFKERHDSIHRLETPLRNVAEVFAHLFYTDWLPWSVCECVKLSEETTTSSSRIFVTTFFQKLGEYMGLPELSVRLKDETLQSFFEGLWRTARQPMEYLVCHQLLHFHWSQSLMDELQEHLKNTPQKPEAEQKNTPSPPLPSVSSSESNSIDSHSNSSKSISDSSRLLILQLSELCLRAFIQQPMEADAEIYS